jgi:hypothetical protein
MQDGNKSKEVEEKVKAQRVLREFVLRNPKDVADSQSHLPPTPG